MSHQKQWIIGGVLGFLISGAMVFIWDTYHSEQGDVVSSGDNNLGAVSNDRVQIDNQEISNLRTHFSFPPYQYQPSKFTPSVPDLKATLAELTNLKNFEHPVEAQKGVKSNTVARRFTTHERQSLAEKNFVVVAAHDLDFAQDPDEESTRVDDWTGAYEKIGGRWGEYYRAPENAPFVTTDYVLHVYHRLLEKEFEQAERTVLFDSVKSLSLELFRSAVEVANNTNGDDRMNYERLSGYFLVPLVLIESVQSERSNDSSADTKVDSLESALQVLNQRRNQIAPEIANQVESEIRLIFEAGKFESSPLLGKYIKEVNPDYLEDYTQFLPRSHYAKNSVLRTYFRSMMWFGRQNFLAKSPELMKDSLIIADWMRNPDRLQAWEAVYVPTTFFVGQSDDLGIYEYQDLLSKIGADAVLSSTDVQKAQGLIKTYRGPAILSSVLIGDSVLSSTKADLLESTRGFRFMGQRFTPDAFILNRLTKGAEIGPKLPSTPTALMVTSVFGDKTSDPLLDDWVTKNFPEGKKDVADRMNELKDTFAKLPDETWTQNLYWSWIRTLKTLFSESKDMQGYPHYMKENDWRIKDTQTALGSWTELKHDTLLYAKQSYAELGGGGDDPTEKPPVPKGYVEPNIEFWDRLLAFSQMTYQGMRDMGLLNQDMQGRNERFLGSLQFFRDIALQEIENKSISEADFERLRMEPGSLKNVISVLPGDIDTEDNARSALIADVHTDVPKNQILYEANGKPHSIYVAVKDANGSRLTRGLVYDYYEFTAPLEKRLTDKDWRKAIYSNEALKAGEGSDAIPFPASPAWTSRLR
ncbi:MAG: DUF3160 domain-containing protein [Candidatus Moraniibacteriota bacterium]